jgi:thiamine pyrophosphate-dependent acetolactate synthase large subunit-like protein
LDKYTICEALADAFAAEGVDTQFVLMGDGNMHWVIALSQRPGIQTVHVRHEHCAVAAAMGYHLATGRTGIASVTCGPGVTQISTALSAAVRARIPLVVFAGESPLNAKYYNQYIEQAPIITATGARYIAAHSPQRMLQYVREAFHGARYERRPVVLGVPYDLQKNAFDKKLTYQPSQAVLPPPTPRIPHPGQVKEVAARLLSAKAPILVGGRGVMRAGAKSAVAALADAVGALLANTLPGRGMFDDHSYSIGVTGGYSSSLAREMFAAADVVVAIGTSLAYQVSDGGTLFPEAHTIQIDTEPIGLRDGMRAADAYMIADARLAAEAIVREIAESGQSASSVVRTPDLARRIATELPDAATFDIAPSLVDPRAAVAALDRLIPKDWDIVSGSGHQAYFNAHMRGRSPENFHVVREFGAIGNGMSFAMGVAAARRNGKVVLIDGDGGFLMHIQELETLRRQGLRILLCILNDGAFGSEVHKLRSDGIDDSSAIFGRPPFEAIAKAFGLRGAEVRDLKALPGLFAAFEPQPLAEVWNIQISDQVTTPAMRKVVATGHGVM